MLSSRVPLLRNGVTDICKVCNRGAKGLNPGIGKRAKLLDLEPEETNELEDIDSEADFMDVGESYHQHLTEVKTSKEKEKMFMIKQKYFKEKFPNFLTWHDKEQMRYLHRTDPEEWSIEKLAEGFPALPETISKIVKSNWSKKGQTRITNHDWTVQTNWKLFKEGKMSNLPPNLKVHLKKFTDRTLIFTPFKVPEYDNKTITTPMKTTKDFVNIIDNYKKLKNEKNRQDSMSKQDDNVEGSMKLASGVCKAANKGSFQTNIKPITLDLLRKKLTNKVSLGKTISVDDQILLDQLNDTQEVQSVSHVAGKLVKCPTEPKSSSLIKHSSENLKKDMSHLIYPEKIPIPKKLYKRGSTYKLRDCFYDSDGLFLYRVPGLVG